MNTHLEFRFGFLVRKACFSYCFSDFAHLGDLFLLFLLFSVFVSSPGVLRSSWNCSWGFARGGTERLLRDLWKRQCCSRGRQRPWNGTSCMSFQGPWWSPSTADICSFGTQEPPGTAFFTAWWLFLDLFSHLRKSNCVCVCCDTFSSHLRMANLFFFLESKHVLEVVFATGSCHAPPKHPRFATCPRHVHPGDSLALVPTDSGGCVCVFPGPRLVRPRMWSRSPQLASRCSLQLPRITSRSPVVRLPSPILEALTSLVSCDPRLCVLDTSARQTHRRLGEFYRQTGKWCSVFRARA